MPDFGVAICGSLLADSICAYHIPDPLHPVSGLSQGGDSIVPFLYRLVVSSGTSPLFASSASTLRHGGNLVCTGLGLGSSVPPSCSSLSSFSLGTPLPPSFAPLSSSFPSVSASGFPSSSLLAAPLLSLASLAPSFPVPSSSVASFPSSLPTPAPPGFPMTPSVRPMAPPVGLRSQVPPWRLLLLLPRSLSPLFYRLLLALRLFSLPILLLLLHPFLAFLCLLPGFLLSRLHLRPLSSPGSCRQCLHVRLLLFLLCRPLLLLWLLLSRWVLLLLPLPLLRLLLTSPLLLAILLLWLLPFTLWPFWDSWFSSLFLWYLGGSWCSRFEWCSSLRLSWLWFRFCWRFWRLGFS